MPNDTNNTDDNFGYLNENDGDLKPEQLDKYHRHELCDRIHCITQMFEELVAQHPAAQLMHEQLSKVSDELNNAYQQAAQIHFQKDLD